MIIGIASSIIASSHTRLLLRLICYTSTIHLYGAVKEYGNHQGLDTDISWSYPQLALSPVPIFAARHCSTDMHHHHPIIPIWGSPVRQ